MWLAKGLKMGPDVLKRWMALDSKRETLKNSNGKGRKPAMSRALQIMVCNFGFEAILLHEEARTKWNTKKLPTSRSVVYLYLRQPVRPSDFA